jgi:hypothetical protein
MANQHKQTLKLCKLQNKFETPIFPDKLFAKLKQNTFMQDLYANTRNGATHKDNRDIKVTLIDFSVDGGGGEQQPSMDQKQELVVNNSGMQRAPKFIKKANLVKLKI